MKDKLVTILVPMYNEEEVLPYLYERLNAVVEDIDYHFEYLFVNDGSKDKSLEIVKDLSKTDGRVSYVDLSRNFGKEIAMAAGFDHCQGDAVVIIDADLQDPPELIPEMIKYWEEGYHDVYAKRSSRKGETFLKKGTSFIFYRLLEKVSNVPIQKDTGDFRLLSRKALNAIQQYKETQRYTKGIFSLLGFKKKSIEYERDPRFAGKTKWNYFKLMGLAMEGITSFTTFPLKLANFFGFFFAIVSFIYMAFIIIKTLRYGDPVAGYPSLISIVLFIGGLQLIGIGILGEYIGRIFNETKNRPIYLINEYYGMKNDK